MSESYQKCVLRKEDREIEVWVPKEISKKRNVLRVKPRWSDEWEEGWVIHEQCHAWTRMALDEVELMEEAKKPRYGITAKEKKDG